MSLFSRKQEESSPADPAMVELGREYAIAKRHGDRKTVRAITRKLGTGTVSDSDRTAFDQGKEAYDAIPPVPTWRRSRRSQ
ncbi:hypothetical protein OG949_23830 [Streptomyces scopuliridis]|uniref:hypothetical protein n=1 Tax=Streptomyces scopuliridis TaxID=452529 RepID=UPI002DD81B74|nr:hypothetical protein [Streptomyces scopuliridis]WSB35570.1 hypothetical protein OG949_23830 [Streptomyces scopuliridis]